MPLSPHFFFITSISLPSLSAMFYGSQIPRRCWLHSRWVLYSHVQRASFV
ncbi:hypothetical protein BGW80DRAFT_1337955 [Lactifluus volemus]|nr:hypothetical protein BGW80DRAFT_1337955 [Lactifluus volemus]